MLRLCRGTTLKNRGKKMYKLKLGISLSLFDPSRYRNEIFDELKRIKELGFDSVELSLGNTCGYKHSMETVFEKIGEVMRAVLAEGLILNSIHLPFGVFVFTSSVDEKLRTWTMSEFQKLFEICDVYNPACYVFHSCISPKTIEERGVRKEVLLRSFKEMSEMTSSYVCMENLVNLGLPNTSTEAVEILREIPNGWACLDTNHFLQEKTENGVLTLGKYIKTLHISDHDYIAEKHQLPKEGKIDWNNVLAALEKVGYNGVFTYEVNRRKYGYTFEDVRRNYDMLFREYNERKLYANK